MAILTVRMVPKVITWLTQDRRLPSSAAAKGDPAGYETIPNPEQCCFPRGSEHWALGLCQD